MPLRAFYEYCRRFVLANVSPLRYAHRMMNSEIYWDELSDAIDNAMEDAYAWADYGDHAEDSWSDADADASTLASVGWGTDEDYGYYGGEDAHLDSYWESLTESY